EPTCTEEGVMTYTCTVCGETKTEAIPAIGHTWDEGVVTTEPTTEAEGTMTYTCSVCGETYTESIAALESEQEDADETSSSSKTSSSEDESSESSSSESSSSESETSGVKTEDSANLILWVALAGIALLAMVAILLTRRRSGREK
ncbi:MAG: hypothetical protein LUG47_05755, partial [Clostridiales bacterium]|nr:hypothetical protein [Clostridiales bacterium]